MYIITVVYMTQSERREALVSCPVLIPELEQGRLIFLFTSLNGYSVCQRVFFFVRPFTIILLVLLTFVTLSPRVQPSQQPASPLRARLCVPGSVLLQGLLLQPTAPCLLLPHGW